MITFENVSYRYPFAFMPAVRNVSFHVDAGELVVCAGQSGSGKSTLTRLITGLVPHHFGGDRRGSVRIVGVDPAARTLAETARTAGLLLQNPAKLFFGHGVEDEIGFALRARGLKESVVEAKVAAAVQRFDLGDLVHRSVLELSDGQKQRVALAGLYANGARLLVLDEPSSNLDPAGTRDLAHLLAELKHEGMTIFLVDHRLAWLRGVADRVLYMSGGRLVADGPFDAATYDDTERFPALRARDAGAGASGGREVTASAHFGEEPAGVRVRGLTFGFRARRPLVEAVDASFPKGRVVGLLGANGCGKTTFGRVLVGLHKEAAGRIHLPSQPVGRAQRRRRVAMVLQDTDHQLVMRTVLEEVRSSMDHRRPRSERTRAALAQLETLALASLAERHPHSLSGGEKQRLAIASALAREPSVLILDEPTSGLDRVSFGLVAKAVREYTGGGGTCLVITHDAELVRVVCDGTFRFDAERVRSASTSRRDGPPAGADASSTPVARG